MDTPLLLLPNNIPPIDGSCLSQAAIHCDKTETERLKRPKLKMSQDSHLSTIVRSSVVQNDYFVV